MRWESVLRIFYCLQMVANSDASLKQSLKSLKFWKKSEPGVWGEWSDWSENCSATCGIGVRRRTRLCSYEGTKRSKRCKGNAGDLKNCDTELTCPVHGGWSKWESRGEECSASCGGGVGKRKRSCTNPEPAFGGIKCNGSAEEYGVCNQHKCSDQVYTLSPTTFQLLMSALKESPLSYEERVNTTLQIPCKPELSSRIFYEYPESILLWTKNGKLLNLKENRITLSALTIVKLKESDSGVYVCSMRYAPDVIKILTIASVAVIPSLPNFMVAEREKAILSCNGYQISRIFNKVSMTWYCYETEIVRSVNLTSPDKDSYRFDNVSSNMTGVWICKVTDMDTGRTWSTNSIYMKVLPPKPKFGVDKILMISGLVLVLTILVIFAFSLKIDNAKKTFRNDLKIFEALYSSDENDYSDSTTDSS